MKPATTVTKVCRILGEFKHRPSVGVTDLTRRLDLLPSDIHRILSSLQIYGYVEQNSATKGQGILVRLAGLLNAPTHLAMLGICEREVSLFKARPGATTVAHSTALGKAILAGMDPQTFEPALDRSGVCRSTGKTIRNWPTCRKSCNLFAPSALPLIGKNRLKGRVVLAFRCGIA